MVVAVWSQSTMCAAHLLVANEKIDKGEFTLLIDSTNIGGGK